MIEALQNIFSRATEQLLGRLSGPMHIRFIITPTMATILALRAGYADAKSGNPPFLWGILTNPQERKAILQSGWKSIRKVAIIAAVLDLAYQLYFFRSFYIVQTLILVMVLALIPYMLIRGITTRLAR